MTTPHTTRFRLLRRFGLRLLGLLILLEAPGLLLGEPAPPAAQAAFDAYTQTVEARLERQHRSVSTFLAGSWRGSSEPVIERIGPPANEPPGNLRGALLHHWRATVFVPGATAADFEHLLRDFAGYPRVFAPQVVAAREFADAPNHLTVAMRVRQKHVLTAVIDASSDVSFGRLDAQHGFSASRSLCTAEVDSAGTPAERTLTEAEEHGFLWRQNTYWTYAEQDGGLALQVESLSLTRSIPAGLGWAVGPYVESIPRESLAFTLRSVTDALTRKAMQAAPIQPIQRSSR